MTLREAAQKALACLERATTFSTKQARDRAPAAVMVLRAALAQPAAPDARPLLQDCDSGLSKALANAPHARLHAKEAAAAISAPDAKPVARVDSWTNGSYSRNYKLTWLQDVPEGAMLYAAAQPAPDVGADERARFEAWLLRLSPDLDLRRDMQFGEYNNPMTNIQWQAWQAAQPAPKPLSVGQAFDLWDGAQTEIGSSIINFARAIEAAHGITAAAAKKE